MAAQEAARARAAEADGQLRNRCTWRSWSGTAQSPARGVRRKKPSLAPTLPPDAAAEQETARARQAAESAQRELDRARDAADRQVAQIREDAAREQAELRAALEAQVAAAENAAAALQARAEDMEAELARAPAERDPAPGQAPGRVTKGAARRRRRSAAVRQDPLNQASPPESPGQPIK